MGFKTDSDIFENILATLAVIENYPDIRADLEPGMSSVQYWKQALHDVEQLMRFNAAKMQQATGLLPAYRMAFFYRNFREICAIMDEHHFFEAETQPGFHHKQSENLGRLLGRAIGQNNVPPSQDVSTAG